MEGKRWSRFSHSRLGHETGFQAYCRLDGDLGVTESERVSLLLALKMISEFSSLATYEHYNVKTFPHMYISSFPEKKPGIP